MTLKNYEIFFDTWLSNSINCLIVVEVCHNFTLLPWKGFNDAPPDEQYSYLYIFGPSFQWSHSQKTVRFIISHEQKMCSSSASSTGAKHLKYFLAHSFCIDIRLMACCFVNLNYDMPGACLLEACDVTC